MSMMELSSDRLEWYSFKLYDAAKGMFRLRGSYDGGGSGVFDLGTTVFGCGGDVGWMRLFT